MTNQQHSVEADIISAKINATMVGQIIMLKVLDRIADAYSVDLSDIREEINRVNAYIVDAYNLR